MVCRQETSPRGSIEPKYFFEHCLYLWVTTTDYNTLHFGGGGLFDCLVWFWEGFFFVCILRAFLMFLLLLFCFILVGWFFRLSILSPITGNSCVPHLIMEVEFEIEVKTK